MDIKNKLEFKSEFVDLDEVTYTPDYSVIGIYFGEGDPQKEGQHWNFSLSLGEDEDQGVCTIRDVNRVILYKGIAQFNLSRNWLVCEFSNEGIQETNVKTLVINFDIDDSKWKSLVDMAKRVFVHESCFQLN